MARTSSAAVLAALIAVAPAAVLAQTSTTTTETPAATGTAPVVVPPVVAEATDAAAQAATEAAATAATAADATADAAAQAADAAQTAAAAATEAATGTTPAAGETAPAATPAETPAATPAADAPAEAPAADAAAAPSADAAAPAAAGDPQVGAYYTKATHGDWLLRCLKTADGKDPCELYQLLKDGEGKAVSEISVIPFTGQAAAIVNMVAPLETDLQAGLGLQIDAGKNNQYPFLVCAPVGCVSRVGLTEAELSTLKRGNKATVALLPFGADPAKDLVKLNLSLTGFTAGFTELQTVVQESQKP